MVLCFDHGCDVGIYFAQGVVQARGDCAPFSPDIIVCLLFLNVEIEDVIGEFLELSKFLRILFGRDERVKPTHLGSPLRKAKSFYVYGDHASA